MRIHLLSSSFCAVVVSSILSSVLLQEIHSLKYLHSWHTLFHVSDIFQRVILIMLLSSFAFSSRAIVLQSLLKLSRVFLSFFSLKSAMSLQTKTTSFFWRATSKRSSQALEDSTSSSTSFFASSRINFKKVSETSVSCLSREQFCAILFVSTESLSRCVYGLQPRHRDWLWVFCWSRERFWATCPLISSTSTELLSFGEYGRHPRYRTHLNVQSTSLQCRLSKVEL